jgi:Flp pilus assembly protein TadG
MEPVVEMSEEANNMKRQRCETSGQDGFALVYMAALLTVLLLFTGLAVDSGRVYVVRAQLSKAVDGAALAAARNLNGGDPKGEATRIFKANFPAGYMGTSSATDPTADPGFFSTSVNAATGINVVDIKASAMLPTSFMKLASFDQVTVTSAGEATRRMVDLSLVLDVSGSIGTQWGAVRDAAKSFIGSFDAAHDRLSLLTFSDGAKVLDQMPSTRGFNKAQVISDVPATLPGGSTAMVEGLYRGWDELRSVPAGTQSGLRIIVLFTDGCSNSVPYRWDGSPTATGLRTYDFPADPGDTHGQTWDYPHVTGLYDTGTGNCTLPTCIGVDGLWSAKAVPTNLNGGIAIPAYAQWMPAMSFHSNHRSAGIVTAFPLQTNALTVDGAPQSTARGLRDYDAASKQFPSEIWNINNAARNLVEIVADAARSDNGDYKIRIYTIGMGQMVPLKLGTRRETAESILRRMANDPDKLNLDHNSAQLDGQYYYATTAADVAPAFESIQNQILRLTK